MENISIEVLSTGILSLQYLDRGVDAGRHGCKTTEYRIQDYRLPSLPSIKCNVLRESLSEDSQNIHCATLKRRSRG